MDYPGIELWEARDGVIGNGDECYDIENYLRSYWNNQFDRNDNHVMSSTLSGHIKIGRRLFVDGVVYTCEEYPSASKKLDTLLRFVLPTSTRGITGTYFGRVIMFFSHIFEGGMFSRVLFILLLNVNVHIYMMLTMSYIRGASTLSGEIVWRCHL